MRSETVDEKEFNLSCCATLAGCGIFDGAGRAKAAAGDATRERDFRTVRRLPQHRYGREEDGPLFEGSVTRRRNCNNGKKPTDANVKAIIDKGGNGMPPYEELLSAEEKANVIAYLKTL